MLLALLIYSKYVTLMVKFKQVFCTVLNSYCLIKNHHEHLLPTVSTDLSRIFQRLLAILLWLVKPTPYRSTYVFRSLLSPKNASVKTVHIHLWDLIPQHLKNASFEVELLGKRDHIYFTFWQILPKQTIILHEAKLTLVVSHTSDFASHVLM